MSPPSPPLWDTGLGLKDMWLWGGERQLVLEDAEALGGPSWDSEEAGLWGPVSAQGYLLLD